MRMILVKETELDHLLEHLKLQVHNKCLHVAKNGLPEAQAAEEVERSFVYHLEMLRSKLKE